MNKYYKIYVCFLAVFFLFSLYSFIYLTVLIRPNNQNNDKEVMESQINSMPVDVEEEGDIDETFNAASFMDAAVLLQVENDGHVFKADELDIPFELEEQEELFDNPPLPPTPRIFWPNKSNQNLNLDHENNEVFRKRFAEVGVISTIPSSWKHCGRPTNALAILADGSSVCVRHRKPHDYLIAGEVLSKELANVLGLMNVPSTFLTIVSAADKWKGNLTALQWDNRDIVAVIQWINQAKHRVKIPLEILQAMKTGLSIEWVDVKNMTDEKIEQLAQWSDLIVFDYITGHFDRVASVQDEADRQNNENLLEVNVPNLLADDNGGYWLIDNEAGLLDAYYLLYEDSQKFRFQKFHKLMLHSMCLFRQETVFAVNHLYQNTDPFEIFLQNALKHEPLLSRTAFFADYRFQILKMYFKDRITEVIAHWKNCGERN